MVGAPASERVGGSAGAKPLTKAAHGAAPRERSGIRGGPRE